jgi:glucose/arabinose dehydrogenase
MRISSIIAGAWAFQAALGAAHAQTAPSRSLFKATTILSNLTDPTHICFLPDGRLYQTRINGTVQIVDPKTGQTTAAGTIATTNVHEDGLHSIILDPQWATNHFIYALYGSITPDTAMVVARFTTSAAGVIDVSTKQELLRVPETFGSQEEHTTGCLAFGPDGNLYIGFADNTRNIFSGTAAGYAPRDPTRPLYDAERSAANSNDLRGKVLRIRPQATAGADGKFYTIPDGNMFPKGTDKTRPEIYVMGLRHPFRITVDSKTGWLFWAEPGPNAGADNTNFGVRGYEEVNLAKDPGYYGWPYCLANNFCNTQLDYGTGKGGATYDPAHLVNSSPNNTGIANLPAARPALVWYPYKSTGTAFPVFGDGSANTAMLGPVYHYDPSNPSTAKLPSYYDGKLFIFDFSRSLIHTVSVDKDGKLVAVERFWDQTTSNPIQNPIDLKVGPDGALYFLDWSDNGSYPHNAGHGNLVKLEYTGPSEPVEPRPAPAARTPVAGWTLLAPGADWTPPAAAARAAAYDPAGRLVWSWSRESRSPQPGTASEVLRVRVESSERP